MEKKAIFAGFGGQGIMLMGRILSQAAMLEGMEVVLTQSYGNEMRGGTANSTVVISNEEIGSPIVEKADGCIVMNLPSLERFASVVRPGGVLVINTSLINGGPERKDIHRVKVPATELANQLGNSQASNLVALGAFIEATRMVEAPSILKALKLVLPKHRLSTLPLNTEAFRKGREWVLRANKK